MIVFSQAFFESKKICHLNSPKWITLTFDYLVQVHQKHKGLFRAPNQIHKRFTYLLSSPKYWLRPLEKLKIFCVMTINLSGVKYIFRIISIFHRCKSGDDEDDKYNFARGKVQLVLLHIVVQLIAVKTIYCGFHFLHLYVADGVQ